MDNTENITIEEEIKDFPEQTTFNTDDMSIVYDEEETEVK